MTKQFTVIFIFVTLLITSCSREKNTALSRAYHNTTSRYNGYFNARELMKAQEESLHAKYVDDYSQILPIFIYPDENTSQAMYPDMDKIIEKCSEVIERHSIYKSKTEHVKWIDDSYYLIGKARLYKEEFGLAEQTFQYVYVAYKKQEERYRGLNWLIKTFIQTRQFDRAEEFLDIAEDEIKKYPDEYLGHFYAIYADYHMKKDRDYDKVIENLEQAVNHTDDKKALRRYTYILAQLYQEKGDLQKATDQYSNVLKLNPDYTMRFNARISRAIAYDNSGGGSEDIKKELNKMLKDIKNEDFKDQIYYALAELELKESNEAKAIDYLILSTKSSVTNKKQKALSYLKLADIYFKRPSYIEAQTYYDSTLQNLSDDHPEYYPTEEKNNSLQELVKNLKVIKRQDSLLALSQLSEKDQKKKIKALIKDLKDEEERRKQAQLKQLAASQERANADLVANANAGGRKGNWYFYNPTTVAVGISDFKVIWGDRPLEDNWRRKNNGPSIETNELTENPSEPNAGDSAVKNEKYDPEFYLKDIPKDIDEQLEAHGKIAEALFNVGSIFKESFTDYNSAISSFQRVTEQYDTSRFNLPSHYQLYRIFLITDNDEKAEVEKKWVLDNHPFSEYAYLIKNPDYNKESKATKEKVEEFYAATYKLYQYGLYEDVIASCIKADKSFSTNHLKAKFDFLKAKSIGFSRTKEEFKKALQEVIKDHPEDPVKEKAQDLLNYLMAMENGNPVNKPAQNISYDYDEKDQHLFILSAEVKKASNFQQLKNQLSDFNRQYFRESNLSVTQSALGKKSLYLVRTFNNQQEAVRYFNALKNNKALMMQLQEIGTSNYLISNNNFRKLFQSQDEQQYINFFNKEYPI